MRNLSFDNRLCEIYDRVGDFGYYDIDDEDFRGRFDPYSKKTVLLSKRTIIEKNHPKVLIEYYSNQKVRFNYRLDTCLSEYIEKNFDELERNKTLVYLLDSESNFLKLTLPVFSNGHLTRLENFLIEKEREFGKSLGRKKLEVVYSIDKELSRYMPYGFRY